jgi:hypothetical protein
MKAHHTTLAVHLVLGQDDLGRLAIVGVGDGMVQEADATNNLANLLRPSLKIRRISDNGLGAGSLALRDNAIHTTTLVKSETFAS